MVDILAAYPSLPSFTQTVVLGSVQYQVRSTWYDRMGAWYVDLLTADGVQVAGGRRVSPGSMPLLQLLPVDAPEDGVLYVRGGGDPYEREWLGADVLLQWFTDAEIAAAAPTATSLISVSVP